MQRCKITSDTNDVLWFLFIRKRRVDGCIMVAKTVGLAWWASETRVSPNKANVTRQRSRLECGMKKLHIIYW
jgi:hypothetical protein